MNSVLEVKINDWTSIGSFKVGLGWGNMFYSIYQTASEMHGHERSRAHQIEVERLRVNEREANKKLVAWKAEMDANLKKKMRHVYPKKLQKN